jgi:CheY-like chemotaxis protein
MAKVLLVEDDQNLREIFEMRLQADGYQTLTAGDGEQALVVAMKEKPDLIIADVMMPKLSGFEMLETMRTSPELNNTRVIMMTALGQAEDRARGEKLGVLKYLVKSQVTLEDFVRVVRDVLQPDQAAAAPAAAPATNQTSADPLAINNQGRGNPMQDPTPGATPQPPDPAMGGTTPTPPTGGDMGAGSDQPTAAEEQKDVQNKVNDWAAGTPSAPGGTGMGDDKPADPMAPPAPTEPPTAPPAGTDPNATSGGM